VPELLLNDAGLVSVTALTLSASLPASTSGAAGTVTFNQSLTANTGQCHVLVDTGGTPELILVTTPATSGNTYNCTRGQEGTPASNAHASGAACRVVTTAALLNLIMARLDINQTYTGIPTYANGHRLVTNWRTRGYLNSAVAMTQNANQRVPIDTASYDPSGGWNFATAGWIVPVSAYYHICGRVSRTPTASNVDMWLLGWVERSGVETIIADEVEQNDGQHAVVKLNDILYLTAGDYLELWSFQTWGTPLYDQGAGYQPFLAAHYYSE
jgi:hypothetical protein